MDLKIRIKNKIQHIKTENPRITNIINHLLLGGFYKFISVILGFIIVPITLNYLKSGRYGIWASVLNILSWITTFDIGIGAGLRNKLSEALASDDLNLAKKYISTAYAIIALFSLIGILSVSLIVPKINWSVFFNADNIVNSELMYMMLISCSLILLNWTLSLCNQVFYAFQKASWTGLNLVVSQSLTLIGLVILRGIGLKSLVSWSLLYGGTLIISNITLTVIFFSSQRKVVPCFSGIDVSKIKDIISIGIKFFIIQISALILSYTSNFIIMRLCGPESVTPFSIANKLFSIPTTLFAIVMSPFWSGFTDAWAKKDLSWIKQTIKGLIIFFFLISILTIIIVLLSEKILNIWIGPENGVSLFIIIVNAVYSCIFCFNMIFSNFLNGVGIINVSFVLSLISALLFLPLAKHWILLYGPAGSLIASIIVLFLSTMFQPIQTYFILRKKKNNRIVNVIFLENNKFKE